MRRGSQPQQMNNAEGVSIGAILGFFFLAIIGIFVISRVSMPTGASMPSTFFLYLSLFLVGILTGCVSTIKAMHFKETGAVKGTMTHVGTMLGKSVQGSEKTVQKQWDTIKTEKSALSQRESAIRKAEGKLAKKEAELSVKEATLKQFIDDYIESKKQNQRTI